MSRAKRSDKGKTSIFTVLLVLIVFLLLIAVILGCILLYKVYDEAIGNEEISLDSSTIVVDMSDPNNDDYGKMYYAPIDEEHIAVENDSVRYIDNEVLIVVKDGTPRAEVEALASAYNAEIVGEIELTGDYQLRFNNVANKNELTAIMDELRANDFVETAMLNYVEEFGESKQTEQRDGFYYGKKWQGDLQNFNNVKGKSWGIEAINVFGAWDALTHTSRNVVPVRIGLVDGGFDVSHEDLDYAEVFYDNGSNGLTAKKVAHGTHVSGIMAASNNNNTGICGVYPYASGKLYGVALGGNTKNGGVNAYSENGDFWTSVMSSKIAYSELIVRNVKVINQSQSFNYYQSSALKRKNIIGWESIDYAALKTWWEDPNNFTGRIDTANIFADFLNRMLQKGYDFVIVSAAGNDSDKSIGHLDCRNASWLNMIRYSDYPDVYDRIIVVGAVDYKLEIADYSNGGNRVDIYAPGGDTGWGNKAIYSTIGGSRYGDMSGTSMAAPHVSGVAAMVWSANNSLTGAQVKEIVCRSGSLRCSSFKLLDAYGSVRRALGEKDDMPANSTENGGVLCYVVEKNNESVLIENAEVTMVNKSTGEVFTTTTDPLGHFELFVPDGKYTLTVKANGYKDYNLKDTVTVKNRGINYLKDWIKMTKDTSAPASPTTPPAATQPASTPPSGQVSTDEDKFFGFIGDDYSDYSYGVPLEDVVAWEYYNGHLYALFDYSLSAHVMSLLTAIDPSVHLVTISDAGEQAAVEELIASGGRDIYYTGGTVDDNGRLSWITGENAGYTNWYTGCPNSYGKAGYDDIVVIYRGYATPAQSDPDFGVWTEVQEDEWSYLDIFDSSVDGMTSGIIIEWDKPEGNG